MMTRALPTILVLMGVAYLAFRTARMEILVRLIPVRILEGRLFVPTYLRADGSSARRSRVEGRIQMKSEVLFSRDVAYLLDCSPGEVLDMARSGQLPAVKQGKFWRFNRADVMVYMRLQKKAKEQLARIA